MTSTTIKKNKLSYAQLALLTAFLLGIFIGAMDTGIVSPVRTVIEADLNISNDASVWVITLYTLIYAVAMPISGKLADLFGKKRIYVISITIFMTGSLLCGLSNYFNNFPLLLIFRAIQAVGGGGIMPIAVAYIGESFPVAKRGLALGFVGAIYGIATLVGPTLGTVLLNTFGFSDWGVIFFVNIPICLIAIGLVVFSKSKETLAKKVSLDWIGATLLGIIISSLMYALSNLNFYTFKQSITTFDVWFFLAIGIILVPFFIIREKRATDPILPLAFFQTRDTSLTLIIAFLVGCGMMGLIFIPQFAENMLKMKPGDGGYAVTLVAVFAGLGGPIGGRIIDKFSAKFLLITGFTISIFAAFFTAFIVIPSLNQWYMYISFALFGLGMGMTMGTPLNYLIQLFANKNQASIAQATLSLIRSIGVAISPNILISFISDAGSKMPTALLKVIPPMDPNTATGSLSATVTNQLTHANAYNIVSTIENISKTEISSALANIPAPTGISHATFIAQEQAKYLDKLHTAAPTIQTTFQQTLNTGFAHIFITIGIFALIALLFTLFLTDKEREIKQQSLLNDIN
ncbi:MAG: MFS transporter [Culicoidibacterales bacterium]